MAKLVVLNQGLPGRACELHTDRTTVGRTEDNTFQIADPSVSSHHCEVHLRGTEIFIRDLNSTNGTFINDAKVTESVLKPGQILKLGQVELKLEIEGAAPPAAAAKRQVDSTMIMPRGISLDQLEKSGRPAGFDSGTVFSKKKNQANRYFLIGVILIAIVIVVLLLFVFKQATPGK